MLVIKELLKFKPAICCIAIHCTVFAPVAHLHAEIVNLHVVFNGQPVLEEEFEYYDATPAPSDFLTGDVHQQLSQLHLLLGEVLQTTSMAGSDSREISQQQQG